MIYRNERILFGIAFVISALLWAVLIYMTGGTFFWFIAALFIVYLFIQSAFISYLKGTGALISANQFPDLMARVQTCAAKLKFKKIPQVYIINGNGILNAFAANFLRKEYIVLYSDIVDAFEENGDAINFYIGHEMGHLRRKHTLYEPFLSLALTLPLLGAAYSRAREYTCDQHGLACCSPEAAQRGLIALGVGKKRHAVVNVSDYLAQTKQTSGFWMSFHELVASYPWLIKRVAHVSPTDSVKIPRRNPLAYLLAIFIPRLSIISLAIIYIVILSISAKSITELAETKSHAESQVNVQPSPQEEYPVFKDDSHE